MNQIVINLVLVCTLILLVEALPNGDGDECTEGFMTVDRIDWLQGRLGITGGNYQGIYPEVGFTCHGTIKQWVFGAELFTGQSTRRPLLQIWRPSNNSGTYIRVSSTVPTNIIQGINYYDLSSPIPFQPGDVLGYFIPDDPLFKFYLERRTSGGLQCGYYSQPNSPANFIDSRFREPDCTFQLFVNVITDPPGCGCGFMSVERMRLILDSSSAPTTDGSIDQRQQISPDMRFTCDGIITKWTILAEYAANNPLYPEIQIWRNVGNSTVYEKISGVSITFPIRRLNGVYEYENFPPIAVKSGNILGISIPASSSSRLQLLSERTNSPIQYYLPIDSSNSSPHDVIDIDSDTVTSSAYQPLVSVEFVRSQPSTIKVFPSTVACPAPASSTVCVCEGEEVGTVGLSPSTESSQTSAVGVCVGAGVGVAITSIIAALLVVFVVVLIIVLVRKRRVAKTAEVTVTKDSGDSVNISRNSAYGVSFDVSGNPAYAPTGKLSFDKTQTDTPHDTEDDKVYSVVPDTDSKRRETKNRT